MVVYKELCDITLIKVLLNLSSLAYKLEKLLIQNKFRRMEELYHSRPSVLIGYVSLSAFAVVYYNIPS